MRKQDACKDNTDRHKINVSVRIRPPRSTSSSTSVDVTSAGKIKVDATKNKSKSYEFSAVVEGSDQELAYNRIARSLLDDLRRGPCTLCAYGQTGSGKTHSVFGPAGCLTVTSIAQAKGGTPDEWGFFPRLVLDILRMDPRSVIHASAIEIYQDAPYDLLADRAPLSLGTKRAGLKVGGGPVTVHGNDRASNHCGTHPPGCSCRKCFEAITKLKAVAAQARSRTNDCAGKSPQRKKQNDQQRDEFATVGETLQRLETAQDIATFALLIEATRTSVGHALNDRSSRSHCLINVHVSLPTTTGSKKMVQRKLLIVDLAGSERIAKSGVTGVARHQATSINGSLTALGQVIRSLSTSQRHVPYRDSTLTMLLRKSLDDAMASTAFVINIAPDTDHIEESICSLNFAQNLTKVRRRQEITSGIDLSSCLETENELESLLDQLQVAKTKLARAEARGQGEQFDPTAPDGEVQLLKKNLKRVKEEEAKVRAARFDLAELRALCKGGSGSDQNTCNTGNSSLKKIASAKVKLAAREKELRNYQDIVARQMSIRGLYRPAKDVYRTCEREVRHLEAQIEMLRAQQQ